MSDPAGPEKPQPEKGLAMFVKALVAFVIAGVVLAMLAFGACVLMLR